MILEFCLCNLSITLILWEQWVTNFVSFTDLEFWNSCVKPSYLKYLKFTCLDLLKGFNQLQMSDIWMTFYFGLFQSILLEQYLHVRLAWAKVVQTCIAMLSWTDSRGPSQWTRWLDFLDFTNFYIVTSFTLLQFICHASVYFVFFINTTNIPSLIYSYAKVPLTPY